MLITANSERFNRLLKRGAIGLVMMLVVMAFMAFLLCAEAVRKMPPEGHVFPREPVLAGTYSTKSPGDGYRTYSRVGEVRISCSGFSYYREGMYDRFRHIGCGYEELNGQYVEVTRVRIPTSEPTATSPVVKIVSAGRVYLDLSDAEIRERWIADTKHCLWFSPGSFLWCFIVGIFALALFLVITSPKRTKRAPEPILPRALRIKQFALKSLIVAATLTASVWATYTYLWGQAKPFTPLVGTVFPREPVLVGAYQWSHGPGKHNGISQVDETRIFCGSFSYYSGTWFTPDGDSDCVYRYKNELQGQPVEVHRVRLPTKNDESHAITIKIVSKGRVYLDLSDEQIREKWIRDTQRAGYAGVGVTFIVFPLLVILGCLGIFWSEKVFKGASSNAGDTQSSLVFGCIVGTLLLFWLL